MTFGCQKEELIEADDSTQNVEHHHLRGAVFYSDSIVKSKKKLFNIVNSNFSSSNSFESRYVSSEAYGFRIDTSLVQVLESDFYESYTFVVYRNEMNDNVLENYIITFFNDSSYVQNLITYPILDGDEGFDIENASAIVINDNSLMSYTSGGCEGFETEVEEWDSSINCLPMPCVSGLHMGEAQQGECEYSAGSKGPFDKCYGGWVTTCSGGGNGNGYNPGGDDDSTGGSVPTEKPEIGVTPLDDSPSMQEKILYCLNGPAPGPSVSIDEDIFNSVVMPKSAWISVRDYLEDNNCSEEAQGLIILTLEAITVNSDFEFEAYFNLYLEMEEKCLARYMTSFVAKTDSPIVSVITNAFFNNDEYNLMFEDVDLPEGIADTKPPSGINFNENTTARIRFDNDYLENSTDLSIAVTTAHEFVHLYMFYLYSEGQLLTLYPSYTELNTAIQNYANEASEENRDVLEHELHEVFDDFIEWMTQSVYTYATDNNIEGVDESYCNKLVIGANHFTNAYQELSIDDQIVYSNIAYNEENGDTDAKGNKCD